MQTLLSFSGATALVFFLYYLIGEKMPVGMFALLSLIMVCYFFAPKREKPGYLALSNVCALILRKIKDLKKSGHTN